MAKDWKDRLGVVYSTNSEFNYEKEEENENQTLEPQKQKLTISIDRKRRKGKTVTLIAGFVGTNDDLKTLSKLLKNKCGVGGSVKDNEILIQGNHKDKIASILKEQGYQIKIL